MGANRLFRANHQGTLSACTGDETAIEHQKCFVLSQAFELSAISVGFPSVVYQFTPVVAATRQ